MRATRPRRGIWVGLGAALLVTLVLGLQYLGSFYAVQITRISKENELRHHLEDLGKLAQAMLAGPALALDDLAAESQVAAAQARGRAGQPAPSAVEIYQASLSADLTAPIREFAARSRLRQVVVLSPEGRMLFDTLQSEPLLRTFAFWPIDRQETEAALDGRLASTPAYPAAEVYFQRTYVPMIERPADATDATSATATGGVKVGAVVGLVADRTYLSEIALLARHLRQANFVLTVLMALIGLLIYRLIQRQRRAERQAADNDRLAALGRLAAGFAHELRNPLGIIRAFTEDLEQGLRRSGGTPLTLEACNDIVEEVDRMDRLVGQFLGYSRGRPPQAGIGQASALEAVESVLAIVRPSADKQGVTLRVEHAPASRAEALRWRARLEQGPLRQVLMNLLLNAIEISPRGGLVRIGVEAQPRRVRLTVSDQGPGIERQERARIFEPFYTTREGGSGLGLAISRQIATSAGGALEVGADPPDGGACFVLTLPRAADVPADESPPTADAATGTQPMQPAGHHGG